jgi:hypothetical protein
VVGGVSEFFTAIGSGKDAVEDEAGEEDDDHHNG